MGATTPQGFLTIDLSTEPLCSGGSSALAPLLPIPNPAPQKTSQVAAPPLELFKTMPTGYLNYLAESSLLIIQISLSHVWGLEMSPGNVLPNKPGLLF